MAAAKNNKNAAGNKGGNGAPSVIDRMLSRRVRSLTLKKIEIILKRPIVKMGKDDYDLYKAVLLKLAGNVLPRLNEHTGEDGQPINLIFDDSFKKNAPSRKTKGNNWE